MNDANNKIPFACMKNGDRYTAYQMSSERYAYNMKWKGFLCPVEGCNRHLKWTNCSVRGKFWSHKQLKTGEGGQHNGGVAHSGETWTHISAKAKLVDNLHLIEFLARKCPDCHQLESYHFVERIHHAKAEHTILKGIRADVAVFKGEKLVAVISIVHTHEREPEKWKKIYDELGVMLFEVRAQTIVSNNFLKEEEKSLWSNIYAHWGRCPECTVREEERLALCRREPQLVLDDGRHVTELTTEELVKFWRKFRSAKGKGKKIEKAKELLREQKKCFCCGEDSEEDLCSECETLQTSTTCKRCGELTRTKWRVHCVKCCSILNSTKCKRCNEPTHSSWKKHCLTCYRELQEEKKQREEEERRRREAEKKKCHTCGKRKKYEWSLYCVPCYYKAKEKEEEEERQKKREESEEEVQKCIRCGEEMWWATSRYTLHCDVCEDAMDAELREEQQKREEEERQRKEEEEKRRREEEQRKRDIAWKKRDREERRLAQQRAMIEEDRERKYWEEYRRKQKLEFERMQEENRKRKVQRMKEEELQEKLKEQAKQRQKEKARKKRQEEKELKVYKETDQTYQKMINENRSDYGLPKKKVQKTMANFFKK